METRPTSSFAAAATALSAVAAAALLSLPAPASACSMRFDVPPVQDPSALPDDGAVDVPTNARIWLVFEGRSSGGYEVRLRGGDVIQEVDAERPGAVLDRGDRVLAERHELWSYPAPAGLLPETTYTAAVWSTGEVVDGGAWDADAPAVLVDEVTFTTGDADDVDAPAVPESAGHRLSTAAEVYAMCASMSDDVAEFKLDASSDFALLAEETFLGEPLTSDDDDVGTPRLGDARPGDEVAHRGRFTAGRRHAVRLGAMDLAGNFSGWSEPVEVTMPLAGCSAADGDLPGSRVALLLLALGALPGLARRRREWGTLVLAGAVVVPLLAVAPGTAAAADEAADEAAADEEAAPPVVTEDGELSGDFEVTGAAAASATWQGQYSARYDHHLRGWAVGASLAGVAHLGAALAVPWRAPGAYVVASWMAGVSVPAVSGLLSTATIRRAIATSTSAYRTRRGLIGGAVVTIAIGATLIVPAAGAAIFGMIGGIMPLVGMIAAVPVSLLTIGTTMAVAAGTLKREAMWERGVRPKGRFGRAPVEVVPGASGLTIFF